LVIDLSTTLACSNIVDSNFAWLSFIKSFDMGIYKICDIDVVPNASSICSGVIGSTNLKEKKEKESHIYDCYSCKINGCSYLYKSKRRKWWH
jgi:hypothetical protein